MLEHGTVVSVKDDRATIELEATDRCEGCQACKWNGRCMTVVVDVTTDRELRESDRVVVEVPTALSMRLAGVVYFVPLAGLVAGAVVGRLLSMAFLPGWPNLLTILLAITGLAVSFVFVHWQEQSTAAKEKREIRVVEVDRKGDELIRKQVFHQ